jgi:hypothetical protein
LLDLAGFIALAGVGISARARVSMRIAAVGKTLLGVSLPDTRGQEQALGNGKARCWSSTSGRPGASPAGRRCRSSSSCKAELGDRGLQFVGIAIDEPAKGQAVRAELGLNYPALIGGYGAVELSKALGKCCGCLAVHVDRRPVGKHQPQAVGPHQDLDLRDILGQLLARNI